MKGTLLKTLTIDLGTHVGWSILADGRIVQSGTLHLATDEELEEQRHRGAERTLDIRFTRLIEFLERIGPDVDRIVFEDVTFSGSPMQNQLWASLRAAIWAMVRVTPIIINCVPVTTLKVFATGSTRADKLAMAKALASADPAYRLNEEMEIIRPDSQIIDDNEVDAIWLARYASAVDRGEQDFLTAYQRKINRREKRRAEHRAAKAARKARRAQKLAEARARKTLLAEAVKASGRCCGVLRRLAPRNRAICPKCSQTIKLQVPAVPAPCADPSIIHNPPTPMAA